MSCRICQRRGGAGLIKFAFRTNNLSSSSAAVQTTWIVRDIYFPEDCFIAKTYTDTSKSYSDVYFKSSQDYGSVVIFPLICVGRLGAIYRLGEERTNVNGIAFSMDSEQPRAAMDIRTYTMTNTSYDACISDDTIEGLFKN